MGDKAETASHYSTDDLLRIMARLRDPDGGCPWDVEQDFASIAPYTIEEAYEVADAIEQNDMGSLKGELGDLLLQVVFHAQMAAEAGHFDYADVVNGVSEKMVVRHPHVFGDANIADADAQTAAWENQKAAERAEKARLEGRRPSVLDDVARGLPALMRAEKLQKRAARIGFDWPSVAPVFDKMQEELDELTEVLDQGGDPDRVEDEMGDILFTCVNLARKLGTDPETALRRTIAKFERRFRDVELNAASNGIDMRDLELDQLEVLWVKAKAGDK